MSLSIGALLGTAGHVLLALAAVVALGRGLGRACRAVGQPPVIGEIIAGILLGPSCLGAFAPAVGVFLFTPDSLPVLNALAQVGVVAYMFLAGLELDVQSVHAQLRVTVVTATASIAVPFAAGMALSTALAAEFAAPGVVPLHFALFVGIAMSITAFPVLARILVDRGMMDSALGALALTCAAVGDVVVWCLLAVLAGVVRGTGTGMLLIATLTAVFVTVMVVWVRPLAVRRARAAGETPSRGLVAGTLIAAAVAAGVTTAIGIHAIFGAFLLGAVIPPDTGLARAVKRGFAGVLAATLLPAFFAYTGVRTEIGLITGASGWLACGAIIGVATAGKLGGTALAGRGAGLSWPVALALGVLMNTRGLMEIIVLNVGLELGLITNTLFTMFVIVAVVTTVTTSPLLDLVLRPAGITPPDVPA